MIKPDQVIPDGEMWPCFVGSGECHAPARFIIDDGRGGGTYICAAHKVEFDAMEKVFDAMPFEKKFKFAEAIAEADGCSVSDVIGATKKRIMTQFQPGDKVVLLEQFNFHLHGIGLDVPVHGKVYCVAEVNLAQEWIGPPTSPAQALKLVGIFNARKTFFEASCFRKVER